MISILTDILSITPLNIFKMFFFLIEFLYLGFAYILFKQQKLMSQTVIVPVSSLFRFLTFIHFMAILVVFLLSFLLVLI